MPRFVVLEHDHPYLHWDFMLEDGDALRTWRLAKPPQAAARISAQRLADHRLQYLDYEGPVSGDRGSVRRWDRGEYTVKSEQPPMLELALQGAKLRGSALLNETPGEATFQFTPE
jgi:hypothetical protein